MPWSKYDRRYVWYFGGIVGRFHLFSLSQEGSFLVIENPSPLDMFFLGLIEINYGLLFFCDFFFQFANLVHNFIQFLLRL